MADLTTPWVDNIGMVEDAEWLNLMQGSRTRYDTYASLPAADDTNTEALYYCSDTDTVYRSDGTAWTPVRIGGTACNAMGVVPTTGWTAVNMLSGCSWAADKDAMLLTVAPNGSADNFMYQYRAYPTPPFTLTTYIDMALNGAVLLGASANAYAGLCISDGTKLIIAGPSCYNGSLTGPYSATGWNIGAAKFTNLTTYSALYQSKLWPPTFLPNGVPHWYRFTDSGTSITWQCSWNGIEWTTMGTEPRTTFLTPTRIGIAAENYATNNSAEIRIRSWKGVA